MEITKEFMTNAIAFSIADIESMGILDGLDSKIEFHKVRNEQRTDLKIVPFNAQRKAVGNNSSIRESLSVKWESGYARTEEIVAIGINPSTAQDGESDTTMTKLCRFLDLYGFNNVTMLNLYESVSPDQDKINKATRTDFEKKREVFDKADMILLVWGINGHRWEKREAMSVLAEYADKLYCIKNPRGKYPAHPSRMPYESVIMPLISPEHFVSCGLCAKGEYEKKYLFQTKTVAELVEEMNLALENVEEMTEEEEIEDDAEGGYFREQE